MWINKSNFLIAKVTEHCFNCLGENSAYVTHKNISNISIKCKNVLHQKWHGQKTKNRQFPEQKANCQSTNLKDDLYY